MLQDHLLPLPYKSRMIESTALANIDGSPPLAKKYRPESVEAFSKISENKLTGTEVFDFPDLPLKYLGYDDNIGK